VLGWLKPYLLEGREQAPTVADPQLGKNIGNVEPDRALRDSQRSGNLSIREWNFGEVVQVGLEA